MTDTTPIDPARARRARQRTLLTQEHIGDLTHRSKSWISNAERGRLNYHIPTHTLEPHAHALALTDPDWLQPGSYPHDHLTPWLGTHVEATLSHVTFTGAVVDVDPAGWFYVLPDQGQVGAPPSFWQVRPGGDVYLVPACNVCRRPEAWPDGGPGE